MNVVKSTVVDLPRAPEHAAPTFRIESLPPPEPGHIVLARVPFFSSIVSNLITAEVALLVPLYVTYEGTDKAGAPMSYRNTYLVTYKKVLPLANCGRANEDGVILGPSDHEVAVAMGVPGAAALFDRMVPASDDQAAIRLTDNDEGDIQTLWEDAVFQLVRSGMTESALIAGGFDAESLKFLAARRLDEL